MIVLKYPRTIKEIEQRQLANLIGLAGISVFYFSCRIKLKLKFWCKFETKFEIFEIILFLICLFCLLIVPQKKKKQSQA